jgi:hypothetical protein
MNGRTATLLNRYAGSVVPPGDNPHWEARQGKPHATWWTVPLTFWRKVQKRAWKQMNARARRRFRRFMQRAVRG